MALCLGLLFGAPALAVGFCNDDLLQQLMLENQIPGFEQRWLALYDFTPPELPVPQLVELGYLPWFTQDDLSVRFFRPLSSFLLALEHWCFGRNAFAPHLHNVLWFLVLAWAVAKLYGRFLSARLARSSAALYAIAGPHAMATAWVAARHVTVSAALAVLALLAHVYHREDNPRYGRVTSLIALGLALGAGETAVGIFPYLILYELSRSADRRRWRWGLGFALIGVAYLAVYTLLGFGARHSGMYLSPLNDPIRFARVGAERLPLLLGQLLAGLPSEIPTAFPRTLPPMIVIGSIGAAAITGCAWQLRGRLEPTERRHVGWLALASLLSLLPALATSPGGRLLPLALIGTTPVSAFVLTALWQERRRVMLFPLLSVAALSMLLFSPAWRLFQTLNFAEMGRAQRLLADESSFDHCAPNANVYLLTGADPTLSIYAGPAISYYHPEKKRRRSFLLSSAPQDQLLTRRSAREFRLELLGEREANDFERLYAEHPKPVGFERHTPDLRARVEATEHGFFTRALFELGADPDSRQACFLVWRGHRLTSIEAPRIGETIRIPHEPGPLGL